MPPQESVARGDLPLPVPGRDSRTHAEAQGSTPGWLNPRDARVPQSCTPRSGSSPQQGAGCAGGGGRRKSSHAPAQLGSSTGCPSSASPQSIPWKNSWEWEEDEHPEPSIPPSLHPQSGLSQGSGPALLEADGDQHPHPHSSHPSSIPAPRPKPPPTSVGKGVSGGRVRPRRLGKPPWPCPRCLLRAFPSLLASPNPLCNLLMHGWSSCLQHGRSRIMGASSPRCSQGIWLR